MRKPGIFSQMPREESSLGMKSRYGNKGVKAPSSSDTVAEANAILLWIKVLKTRRKRALTNTYTVNLKILLVPRQCHKYGTIFIPFQTKFFLLKK